MTMAREYSSLSSTVCVLDDDLEICKALKWLLESVHMQVKTFNSPLLFLDKMEMMNIACVILDIRMPEMSGLELLSELKIRKTSYPVIVITGHGDINMAVRAMKMGAKDFLTKPFDDQYLVDLVQGIIASKPNIEFSMKEIFATLSNREKQVLELIINGQLNKQIADSLEITVSTVEFHRARIMKKTKARTLSELMKLYFTST